MTLVASSRRGTRSCRRHAESARSARLASHPSNGTRRRQILASQTDFARARGCGDLRDVRDEQRSRKFPASERAASSARSRSPASGGACARRIAARSHCEDAATTRCACHSASRKRDASARDGYMANCERGLSRLGFGWAGMGGIVSRLVIEKCQKIPRRSRSKRSAWTRIEQRAVEPGQTAISSHPRGPCTSRLPAPKHDFVGESRKGARHVNIEAGTNAMGLWMWAMMLNVGFRSSFHTAPLTRIVQNWFSERPGHSSRTGISTRMVRKGSLIVLDTGDAA